MNPNRTSSSRLRTLGLLGPVLGGVVALCAPLRAAEPAEPKTFVLFMGADIDVELNRKPLRVQNVAGDAFVVVVDGKSVPVPMDRGPIGLKVNPQLKLSNKTAAVHGLTFERAYTPENDPNRKWAARQSGSAAQAAISSTANQMVNASQGATQASLIGSRLLGGPGVGNAGAVPSAVEQATTANFERAAAAARSDLNSAAYASQQLQEELDKQLFDAVRVTCEVSAPRPMADPYLILISQYREKDDPVGTVKNWVYAWQLDRLDATPLKIRIIKGGFPPGFELLKQQFHLYAEGRELGTNVADKNVPLTREEAHQYIVIDHLVTHKKDTLPPGVALGVSPKDLTPHFAAEQVQQVIYVKVDKDGLPGGAFRNERCTEPAGDDYLEKLVGQVRFKPAIKSGKAVDGVAKLRLAELAL